MALWLIDEVGVESTSTDTFPVNSNHMRNVVSINPLTSHGARIVQLLAIFGPEVVLHRIVVVIIVIGSPIVPVTLMSTMADEC